MSKTINKPFFTTITGKEPDICVLCQKPDTIWAIIQSFLVHIKTLIKTLHERDIDHYLIILAGASLLFWHL